MLVCEMGGNLFEAQLFELLQKMHSDPVVPVGYLSSLASFLQMMLKWPWPTVFHVYDLTCFKAGAALLYIK